MDLEFLGLACRVEVSFGIRSAEGCGTREVADFLGCRVQAVRVWDSGILLALNKGILRLE